MGSEMCIRDRVKDPVQTDYALKQMQPFLYYTLQSVIEGGAQLVIEQVSEENGLEAFRLLHLRFAKSKMQNAIMRMATIVNMKFNDNANFETTFSDWEYEIHKFNSSVDNKLSDEVKVGILVAGTTGKLHDHLCLTLGQSVDYAKTREVVLNYIKSKNLTTKTKQEEKPVWMDVSSLTKGGKKGSKGQWTKGGGKGAAHSHDTTKSAKTALIGMPNPATPLTSKSTTVPATPGTPGSGRCLKPHTL